MEKIDTPNNDWFCRGRDVTLGHDEQAITSRPFSFSLPRGSLTAVLGPNGSGKTTLLKAMLGEPGLLSGGLFLLGSSISAHRLRPKELSRWVAFVPQEHVFASDSTLDSLLKLAYLPRMGLFGGLPDEAADEIEMLTDVFSLSHLRNRMLKSLSTGERQKSFLGRALLQKPKLLVLDEPTNHLDPGAVFSFWDLLLQRRKNDSFEILISTHDLDFAATHADWVLALKEGNLHYCGPCSEFMRSASVDELYQFPAAKLSPSWHFRPSTTAIGKLARSEFDQD